MKKMIVMALMLVGGFAAAFAQSSSKDLKPAEIKFEKVSHNPRRLSNPVRRERLR